MDKQEVLLLAQLLKTLQTLIDELSNAEQHADIETFEQLKREALGIQKKIEEMV